jgi:ABC-2 type transport system ATP-binding protein
MSVPAVQCTGLVKRFGDVTAVDGLDLRVERGECFGLLGPNGAGKTTTIEICEGIQRPDEGEVLVLGMSWERDEQELRMRMGIQLQETKLADKLSVAETVTLFRSFYRSGRSVEEVLDAVELTEKRNAWVVKLSGGQRQRLSVACALVGSPDVLFLDEPTTGLDPQSRRQLWDIVTAFQADGGTVLLTTHYMEEAHRLCDRVAVVDRGRIIAQDTPDALIASLGASHVVEFTADGSAPSDFDGLDRLPGVDAVRVDGSQVQLTVGRVHQAVPALIRELAARGVELSELRTHHATLEDVFLRLTGRHLRDE